MDKKNEKIIELTLEQMDMISGGTAPDNAALIVCPICKSTFTNAYALGVHFNREHSSGGNHNTPAH